MNIKIDEESVPLHYDGLIKEDYDNSGGLARWIAQGMIMMGTAYIAGAIGTKAGIANATAKGNAGVGKAFTEGIAMSQKKYDSGKPYGWKEQDTDRLAGAINARSSLIESAQEMADDRIGSQMTRVAGRSFAGATRLMAGGSGFYSAGISEFIYNKAYLPLLKVEARTSKVYLENWTRKMNQHIANFDFYFGDDPELTEQPNFGKVRGMGKKIFQDESLHGWTQLSENTFFPFSSSNPLIIMWKKQPIFLSQKCCGMPDGKNHLTDCKIPRLTKDDFFGGFDFTVQETTSREGSQEIVEWTTTETHTTTADGGFVSGTFGFVFAWCGNESDSTNKIPLGDRQGNVGAFKNIVFNGDADKDKGDGKIGNANCFGRTEAEVAPFRGRQYHEIRWGHTNPANCGKLIFGKEPGCDILITRYEKGNKKEELIHHKKPEEYWVLEYSPSEYNAAGGLAFRKYSEATELVHHKVEKGFPAINLTHTINLKGFSGMEGWGSNFPDSFGGSGGTATTMPTTATNLSEQPAGMTVPTSLGIGSTMSETISSMLNTENPGLQMPTMEMPQGIATPLGQQQQEWASEYAGIGQENLNTERGEVPPQTDKNKEKVGEK